MREAVSQILYCCTGEHRQYEETINTVIGAVETYLCQLAVTALRSGETPDKVKPVDILAALRNDSLLHAHVEKNYNDLKERNKKVDDDMGIPRGHM